MRRPWAARPGPLAMLTHRARRERPGAGPSAPVPTTLASRRGCSRRGELRLQLQIAGVLPELGELPVLDAKDVDAGVDHGDVPGLGLHRAGQGPADDDAIPGRDLIVVLSDVVVAEEGAHLGGDLLDGRGTDDKRLVWGGMPDEVGGEDRIGSVQVPLREDLVVEPARQHRVGLKIRGGCGLLGACGEDRAGEEASDGQGEERGQDETAGHALLLSYGVR